MKQGEDGRLNRLGEPLLPNPTVIVCSGSGVHLYYIFQKPIRVNKKSFPKQYKSLNNYKYCLMYTLWKKLGITERELEIQGIDQRYRVVGTRTKSGSICRAFFMGQKVTLEYMNQFSSTLLVEEDMDSYRSVELPKLYEIENTAPGTGGKNREKQQTEKRKYPRYGSLGQGA